MKYMPLLVLVVLAFGCTESNPSYLQDAGGGQLDLVGLDGQHPTELGPKLDTIPWPPDLMPPSDTRPVDLLPPPDVTPWQCTTDGDCTDSHPCTKDRCQNSKCDNTLEPHYCLIGGVCHKEGQLHPTNSCLICYPKASTNTWAVQGNGQPCAKDALDCTSDICESGICIHPLAADNCLIGNTCYSAGDGDPSNACVTCQPGKTAYAFSPAPDSTPCAVDGLPCTADQCVNGKCEHPVKSGHCLINGVCRADGATKGSDACNECVASTSQSAWTFVAGKPCNTGPGVARMCHDNKCRGWIESYYQPPAASPGEAALNGVDFIEPANAVWAVGQVTGTGGNNASQGLLVPLGPTTPTAATMTKAPLRDVHYRAAVGDQGQVWYHDGTKWTQNTLMSQFLNGAQRYSVHGLKLPGTDVFYLGGPHDQSSGGIGGIVRCAVTGISVGGCQNHTGFSSTSMLGGVYATLALAWAIHVDLPGNQPEDIYVNTVASTSWNRNPPLGCQDQGNSPCGNTYGAFLDIYGSSPTDIWVVGSYGNMLHFNGINWTRLTGQVNFQDYQVMKAVYSSPADGLVSIASHRATGSTRWVNLYNYNIALKRWFGPLTVWQGGNNYINEIRDLGGKGYDNLWMVGRKEVVTSTSTSVQGWILQLQ